MHRPSQPSACSGSECRVDSCCLCLYCLRECYSPARGVVEFHGRLASISVVACVSSVHTTEGQVSVFWPAASPRRTVCLSCGRTLPLTSTQIIHLDDTAVYRILERPASTKLTHNNIEFARAPHTSSVASGHSCSTHTPQSSRHTATRPQATRRTPPTVDQVINSEHTAAVDTTKEDETQQSSAHTAHRSRTGALATAVHAQALHQSGNSACTRQRR